MLVVGLAALLAIVAAACQRQVAQRLVVAGDGSAYLHSRLSSASSLAVQNPPTDFAQQLPPALSAETVVRQFQQSSAQLGVILISVSAAPRDASVQTLGRAELSVTLRGSYPHLKTVLSESLDRFPGLVLQRMTLRRQASPTELEARVELVLVTRPLSASRIGR